jgi:hypothetical protein
MKITDYRTTFADLITGFRYIMHRECVTRLEKLGVIQKELTHE